MAEKVFFQTIFSYAKQFFITLDNTYLNADEVGLQTITLYLEI